MDLDFAGKHIVFCMVCLPVDVARPSQDPPMAYTRISTKDKATVGDLSVSALVPPESSMLEHKIQICVVHLCPPPPRPPHSACTKPFPSADTPFQCFPSVIWAKLEATAEDEARETHLRLRRTMRSSLSEGPDRQHSTRNTDLFLQILKRSLFNRLPGEGVLARE